MGRYGDMNSGVRNLVRFDMKGSPQAGHHLLNIRQTMEIAPEKSYCV